MSIDWGIGCNGCDGVVAFGIEGPVTLLADAAMTETSPNCDTGESLPIALFVTTTAGGGVCCSCAGGCCCCCVGGCTTGCC